MIRKALFLLFSLFALLVLCACNSNAHGLMYLSDMTAWLLPEKGEKIKLFEVGPYPASFSQDLESIAFTANLQDVWIAESNGNNQRNLIRNLPESQDLEIAKMTWAPDKTRIGILAIPRENSPKQPEKYALFVVDVGSKDAQEIAVGVTAFVWVSDTNDLVVVKNFDPGPAASPGLYLLAGDGTKSEILFEGLIEPYVAICKNRVVSFIADRVRNELTPTIMLYDLHSGKTDDLLVDTTPHIFFINDPVWSNNGDKLAFTAFISGTDNSAIHGLYKVDLKDRDMREVAKDIANPLVWSPDDKAIATTLLKEQSGIYKIQVENGSIELLTFDSLSFTTAPVWR